MDEITTAVVHIKQLYVENLKQLEVYKRINKNTLTQFNSKIKVLKKQKELFCRELEAELRKFEKLGVKVLIYPSKLSNFLSAKLNRNDQATVLITLNHLENYLLSEYKYSLSMLNKNGKLYALLSDQSKDLQTAINKLQDNSFNELQLKVVA